MAFLKLAAMDKLLRKAGAKRVSDDAKKALSDLLEAYSDGICAKAVQLAKHGGRTTVKAADIALAAKT
jgi:histone H3/H4